jgi:ribosomal protein S18 acetylase RimI-like enzyme
VSLELYFLRSSEQKIVNDMIYYAQRIDENKNKEFNFSHLNIYSDFYGLTPKDLGLYAMKDNKMCGAIWSRRLNLEHKSNGFISENTPVLNIAVKPEFRYQGIARAMMEQFLLEAGSLYETLSVSVLDDKNKIDFFKKFGFEIVDGIKTKSYVDDLDSIVMIKKLQKQEIIRPTDGYDAKKWMD